MKAIYKLGITVQDLVNNSCSGLLIPFYEMLIIFLTTKSQHSLKSFGVLFWGVLLLNCHSIAGAHLGTTNRTCVFRRTGLFHGADWSSPFIIMLPAGLFFHFPCILTDSSWVSGGLCDSHINSTIKNILSSGHIWGKGKDVGCLG